MKQKTDRARREKREKCGMCGRCGMKPQYNGLGLCIECRNNNNSRRRNVTASKDSPYHKRKKSGLCVTCGKIESVNGMTFCKDCLSKHRQNYAIHKEQFAQKKRDLYNLRKSRGECVQCGILKVNKEALCSACAHKRAQAIKRRRLRNTLNRLCSCGKPVDKGNKRYCKEHREINNARRRKLEHQRKESGICPYCLKMLDRKGSRCTLCLEKGNSFARDRYQETVLLGLCVKCHVEETMPGQSRCAVCILRNNYKKEEQKHGEINSSDRIRMAIDLFGIDTSVEKLAELSDAKKELVYTIRRRVKTGKHD